MEGQKPVLRVQVMAGQEDLGLPSYATAGSAGLDLRAALTEPLTLPPGERAMVPTGLKMAIPEGFEGCLRPRSGLAAKHGIAIVNAPGTIDADYRGEVRVLLINHGKETVTFQRGDRIAQLLIQPVARVEVVPSEDLEDTSRGEGGFGHTGR